MTRFTRLYTHLFCWALQSRPSQLAPYKGLLVWFGDLIFLCADLLFVPELYSFLLLIIGRKGTPLTTDQVDMLRPIFRESVDYKKVRLHDRMPKFITKKAYAFVLWNTINFRSTITKDVLVHEMVHIWQYQRFGSPYILRALLAQASKAGYDYGGIEQLYAGVTSGRAFTDFNFEQQGDIIQDAYLQSKGIRGINNAMYEAIYRYYTSQLSD